MTEVEWLAATDPMPMLAFLRDKVSDRKLRLAACGFCRLKWVLLTDQASRAAVTVTEKYADGAATRQVLKKIRRAAYAQWRFPKLLAAWHAADLRAWEGACASAESVAPRMGSDRDEPGMAEECVILRDIFGNPFRPVAVDPSWLTSTVVSLAEGIYAERAFDRMPILADALMDAGCDNEEVLNHCRSDGVHVRGCWLIDLLTGRK